jgi:hypothetical protein
MQLDIDDDRKALKQMHLPWWGVVWVIVGAISFAALFDLLGRFDLARPTLYSMGAVVLAIAVRWKLRRHVWFWVTMAIIAALHILVILFVPWTTQWVPAIVVTPIVVADLYAMLAILSVVGKFLEESKAPER